MHVGVHRVRTCMRAIGLTFALLVTAVVFRVPSGRDSDSCTLRYSDVGSRCRRTTGLLPGEYAAVGVPPSSDALASFQPVIVAGAAGAAAGAEAEPRPSAYHSQRATVTVMPDDGATARGYFFALSPTTWTARHGILPAGNSRHHTPVLAAWQPHDGLIRECADASL